MDKTTQMENHPSAPRQNFLSAAIADLRRRPRGNVPSLDILRSAAILLVFSGHVGGDFSGLRIVKLPFIFWGWTGVDLFFILSGYLIGGQLHYPATDSRHLQSPGGEG